MDLSAVDLGIRGIEGAVRIGTGGFANVYRARQSLLNRAVAVKVLMVDAPDSASERAFLRECQAIGVLSERANILTVYDAGVTESGRPYLIMALAIESLDDRVRRDGQLPWREVTGMGLKLARALSYVHDAGILHRDLKPGNILVLGDGEPQIADFGIARMVGATQQTRSQFALTPAHAPPEAFAGRDPAPAADIYSLSSTLFHLIAGHPAFVPRRPARLPRGLDGTGLDCPCARLTRTRDSRSRVSGHRAGDGQGSGPSNILGSCAC